MQRSRSRSGSASWWSALTRQRPHRLVDLLLGLFLLGGIAVASGSLSWILALAVVVAVTGIYLDGLRRWERNRRERR